MGCGTSKLDDLPAVSLCRARRAFLDEAVRHRFALAESHASYLRSLSAVAISLDRFFNLRDPDNHLRSPSDSDDASASDSHANTSYMKIQTTDSMVYTESYPHYANNGNQNYSNHGGSASLGGSHPPTSKAPPSPPRSSAWDFLNPFETFDSNSSSSNNYYGAYSTPSHDISSKVREEEGIPDLEEDDDCIVDEEVHPDQKLCEGDEKINYSNPLSDARVAKDVDSEHVLFNNDTVGNANEMNSLGVVRGDSGVVREIQVQFERASECGSGLAKLLEVGKLPYKWKRNSHRVSWKTKRFGNGDPALLDLDQDVELRSKNLSSTLHKLHLWETKLYEEVKVEEKMRVLHEHKSRKMKRMDENGTEAQKVEAAKTFVRSLSTNIKIAIQVVDKISVKIGNLRDEELLPQLHDFIQGLARMWKSMLECHRNQCRAIGEAKHLDAMDISSDSAHLEATRQLEQDLVHWTLRFSHWVRAQKFFVGALNNWLTKCLLYVPEETPDGIAPFSPGRIGAPQVFVMCHRWSQLLDGVSEKEVVDSMRDFASNVLRLWDRDKAEIRQRMSANKEESKMKSLEKEEQMIQKGTQTMDKKTALVSAVYPSETSNEGGSLQASLQHVLEAMRSFAANSLKVYEELLQEIEA